MRTAAFRDRIRNQDCRCVVTVQPSLSEKWSMAWFRSRSYLFLAFEHIFIGQGYSQLVTNYDGISRKTVSCDVLIFISGMIFQYQSTHMMDIRPMHF